MAKALYERISIENRRFALTKSVWPKISSRRGHFPPTILRKLGSFMWYKNVGPSFFCFVTMRHMQSHGCQGSVRSARVAGAVRSARP